MKKRLLSLVIGLALGIGVFVPMVAQAQVGGSSFWKRLSTGVLLPIIGTDSIGSTLNRVPAIYTTILDAGSVSMGGVVAGDQSIGGNLYVFGALGANALKYTATSTGIGLQVDGTGVINKIVVPSSTNSGATFYNTPDQVTNVESATMFWNPTNSKFNIQLNKSGTGQNRQMVLSTAGSALNISGDAGMSQFQFSRTTAGVYTEIMSLNGTQTQTSGVVGGITVQPTINQSGTAGYSMLKVNPTETTVGSGIKNLLDLQVGGVSRMTVANTGAITVSSSTASGITFHNQTDQTTNFERAAIGYVSDVFTIGTSKGGSRTERNITLRSGSSSGSPILTLDNGGAGLGYLRFTRDFSSVSSALVRFSGILTHSTLTTKANPILELAPTINQTGTAGYTGLLVNPTETSVGSGPKNLMDLQVGGTSRLAVDNYGMIIGGSATSTQFKSQQMNASTNAAFTFDTANTMTGTTRLLSFKNGGVEKGYIGPTGNLYVADGIFATVGSLSLNSFAGNSVAMNFNGGGTGGMAVFNGTTGLYAQFNNTDNRINRPLSVSTSGSGSAATPGTALEVNGVASTTSMVVSNTLTVGGQSVCLADGTNCSGGGGGADSNWLFNPTGYNGEPTVSMVTSTAWLQTGPISIHTSTTEGLLTLQNDNTSKDVGIAFRNFTGDGGLFSLSFTGPDSAEAPPNLGFFDIATSTTNFLFLPQNDGAPAPWMGFNGTSGNTEVYSGLVIQPFDFGFIGAPATYAPIVSHNSATSTLNFTTMSAGTYHQDLTITVPGAEDGDECTRGVPNALASRASESYECFVSATDTITIRRVCSDATGCGDPSPAVVRASFWKH